MFTYYSLITMISWLSLFALSVLVHENSRLTDADKRLFYLTYLLIAVSALAEWMGVLLDGREDLPKWPLMIVKCLDYILTPMAGGTLVRQMRLRNRWLKAMNAVLLFNALLQILSCPFGWMVSIDKTNHYYHGPLYFLYIAVYLAVIIITGVVFILYGKTFRRENRLSLYSALALVVAGIGVQEATGGNCRTVYLSLTLAAALLFIHFCEFTQLATDDFLSYQRMQLQEDPLTGVQSRYAYKQALQEYASADSLPKDLAAYVIDINWLKETNDNLGHEAGDELICGAARCIEKVFAETGRCFRTGGDEFAVIAKLGAAEARKKQEEILREAQAWTGVHVKELSFSVGCAHAADSPGLNCKELIEQADQAMYAAKTEYYQHSEHNRRTRSNSPGTTA